MIAYDLMFGARLLRKSPGFTLIATLSLALAIGANTSIFSIAKQLLFERLDVSDAASLRLLTTTAPRTTATAAAIATDANFAYPVYVQLRTHNRVMDDLLAFHTTAVNATLGDRAERVTIHQVSGNYYGVLGVQPQFGRSIRPADDTAGSDAVAVISDGLGASWLPARRAARVQPIEALRRD